MKLKGTIEYVDHNGHITRKELSDKYVESIEHAIAEMRSTGAHYCREGILISIVGNPESGPYNFYPPSSIKTIEFVVEDK